MKYFLYILSKHQKMISVYVVKKLRNGKWEPRKIESRKIH